MNFDFSEDLNLLRDQARRFLKDRCPPAAARAILEGKATWDAPLWDAIASLGWMGAAIPEEYGGLGLGHEGLCVIAEELGRAIAPVPFASSVYLATEAVLRHGTDAQRRAWLPALAAGESIGCFALFEGPGNPAPSAVAARVAAGRISGRPWMIGPSLRVSAALVPDMVAGAATEMTEPGEPPTPTRPSTVRAAFPETDHCAAAIAFVDTSTRDERMLPPPYAPPPELNPSIPAKGEPVPPTTPMVVPTATGGISTVGEQVNALDGISVYDATPGPCHSAHRLLLPPFSNMRHSNGYVPAVSVAEPVLAVLLCNPSLFTTRTPLIHRSEPSSELMRKFQVPVAGMMMLPLKRTP